MMEDTSNKISRRDALKMMGAGALAALVASADTHLVEAAVGPTNDGSARTAAQAAVTLVFWREPYAKASKLAFPALDEFYKKQLPEMLPKNVTVNTVEISGQERFSKISASIAAGDPPDVAWVDQTEVPPLLSLKAINAMPDGLIDVTKAFGAFANDFMRVDGKVYILPWGWWERGVFYNIGLLKQKGIKPEDLPRKLSDFIPFVQKLTEWPQGQAEPTLAAWPLAGGTTFDLYTALVDNLGGFWWMDDTSSGFDQPEWEESWQMTLAMFDTFKVDARQGESALDKFYSGKAYFLSQQLWVGNALRTDHPDIEWGVMTHPTPNGGPPYGWKEVHTGWGNLSAKTGEGLDGAFQLWKALYSPELSYAIALSNNYIPGRLEVVGKPPITADNPQWAGAFEKHQDGNSVCPGFWNADLWDAINASWDNVYLKNAPVKDTLQALKQTADAILTSSPELQATIVTKKDYETHPEWTNGKIPAKSWWDKKPFSYLTPEQASQIKPK
jgi:ABC-type glycerol-3-phosphate transport system substrate-binding protein